jgi:hypothetical protein
MADGARVQNPTQLRSARVASALVFAVHGALIASFAARVPVVADQVGVGTGGLGMGPVSAVRRRYDFSGAG